MSIIQYPRTYNEELRTGTDEAIETLNKVLSKEDIIASNIIHLSWTVLDYYFPDNRVESIADVDLENENATIWYFEQIDSGIDKNTIVNSGYSMEKIYTGNINGNYYFNIYKLEKFLTN